MKKKIAIYGSTGSIGTQALEVIEQYPEAFEIKILSANNNDKLFIEQCLKYKPSTAIIVNEKKYDEVKLALAPHNINVLSGEQALVDIAQDEDYDILLAAIVGFAGLRSTLAAIKKGKTIALANKETLVVAGDIVMQEAEQHKAKIIPVDSEHSAIFQCLVGEKGKEIEKIFLTASGGPFLGKKTNFLVNVKKTHALQHPNWVMGAKITIDSATLMNKGLEMIEAKWLFSLRNEQIDVIIHPQSIIHSIVEFVDGSQKAQLGHPSMKLPIQYAITYPKRMANNFPKYDLRKTQKLTFEEADIKTFRNLALAKAAMEQGGNMPCILNSANEVVVEAFLNNKVGFMEMSDIIELALQKMPFIAQPGMEDYYLSDAQTRDFCKRQIVN